MNQIQDLIETRCTEAQKSVVDRMLKAPAMAWKISRVLEVTLLGVKCEGVAVQIEAPKAKIWGVILPNGEFVKPLPGRKTIDLSKIAYKM